MSLSPASKSLIARAALTDLEHSDARRIVECAVTVCAIPGMVSARSRDVAIAQLRSMLTQHPRQADVLAAIIQHLESYS